MLLHCVRATGVETPKKKRESVEKWKHTKSGHFGFIVQCLSLALCAQFAVDKQRANFKN